MDHDSGVGIIPLSPVKANRYLENILPQKCQCDESTQCYITAELLIVISVRTSIPTWDTKAKAISKHLIGITLCKFWYKKTKII
jgi:hypothetical protein